MLAGMGGLGKSTVALAVARRARARGWRVWWVTASDSASLTGGMLEILQQLGAPESVIQPVREGAPTAAGRAWEFLNDVHGAGRRWLLIFDNADAPAVLAARGVSSPADYAGWLRPDPAGMVIVTSRVKDPGVWGPGVVLSALEPLDAGTAGRVLADLAPGIADPGGEQATDLGRRLGDLPLALHLAGAYLASPFARWHTFGDYRDALDGAGLGAALADLDEPGARARATIRRTWDLSLDALAADGRPQARPLLYLLSCYAPGTPIPAALLRAESLASLLGGDDQAGDGAGEPAGTTERPLREGLLGLATVGLIDVSGTSSQAGWPAVTVHPVVADANRSRLLAGANDQLPVIGGAAVGLLHAARNTLDGDRPADWPVWYALAPHLAALLGWLAGHLDTGALTDLLGVSAPAADALRRGGHLAAAEDLAQASVTAAGRLGSGHPAALTARQGLAKTIGERGRNRQAEQLYRELLADQQRVLGDQHPDILSTRQGLALMIEYQGRFAEAQQLYHQVLADQQRQLGDQHPGTLATRNIHARVTGMRGLYRTAEELSRRLLADLQRILGDQHPETLTARHNLAWMISQQGRHREAEQIAREVLGQREQILGDHHPDTLATRQNLARQIGLQGGLPEAERLTRYVLAQRQQILGEDHPATLATRHTLAWLIDQEGRHAEAEQLLRRVLADRRRILGDEHPSTHNTRFRLAHVLAGQGQNHEAADLLSQVLAHRRQVLGDQHPETVETQTRLKRILPMAGNASTEGPRSRRRRSNTYPPHARGTDPPQR